MRQGLAQEAVNGVLSNKVHPKTGEPIVPLGILDSGRVVWPMMGAAPDDEDNDEGDADDADTDEGEDNDGDSDADNKSAATKAQDKKLTEENARRRTENKSLRTTVAELTTKLKEFTDKDKGDLEKASESVQELTTRTEKAEQKAAELALQNAFLADNSFKWRNPKAALRLVDLSKVEIDDDGEVTGLNDALKALAKSDPYLLNAGDEDDEDEPKGPAGQAPKTKKPKGTPERDKLLSKYPALRR